MPSISEKVENLSSKSPETMKSIELIIEHIDDEEFMKTITHSTYVEQFTQLTTRGQCEQVAKIVAELAKKTEARTLFTDADLIEALISCLGDGVTCDPDNSVQIFRAVGNLCFENDDARKIVLKTNFNEYLKNNILDFTEKYHFFLVGCLLNYINSDEEDIQKLIITEQLCYDMVTCLSNSHNQPKLTLMIIIILEIILCSEIGQSKMHETKIVAILYSQLNTGNEDNDKAVYALLMDLLDTDEGKRDLICEFEKDASNFTWLLSYADEPCKMLIILLTEDICMKKLYNNASIMRTITEWVESEEVNLRSGGALCYTNFARNASNIDEMISTGLHKKMIKSILQAKPVASEYKLIISKDEDGGTADNTNAEQQGPYDACSMIHSYVSCLRNIAVSEKSKLLEENVIEATISLIHVDFLPLQFKLVSLYRMLILSGEDVAIELGTDQTFIDQLMVLSCHKYQPQVLAESSRLVSYLVKFCHSKSMNENMIRSGSVPILVQMMLSEHILMRSEAVLALTILVTTCLDSMSKYFEELELIKKFQEALVSKDSIDEIKLNILSAFKIIVTNESLKKEYQQGMKTSIASLNCNSSVVMENMIKTICDV